MYFTLQTTQYTEKSSLERYIRSLNNVMRFLMKGKRKKDISRPLPVSQKQKKRTVGPKKGGKEERESQNRVPRLAGFKMH